MKIEHLELIQWLEKHTPNFSYEELTVTKTIYANDVPEKLYSAFKNTALKMEEIRKLFDAPITVNSCYRDPVVNAHVGGSKTSQHMKAEAADFEVKGFDNFTAAEKIVESDIFFDQIILENYTSGVPTSGWIHCSFCVDPKKNRRQVLTATRGKNGMVYSVGLNR